MRYIIALFLTSLVSAETYEDWGNFQPAGYYYADMKSEYLLKTGGGKWYVNTWKKNCRENLKLNQCYAPIGGKLYFHGDVGEEEGINGHGSLLVSDKIKYTSGISVEVSMRAYCFDDTSCWANIGIYRGEGTYRSIGYKNANNKSHFNIWGPINEKALQDEQPGRLNKYKVVYWFTGNRWRWDYHINNEWVAGHFAEDYAYKMGGGFFVDNAARIAIGFGGYRIGGYSEGHFERVKVSAW